jgi:hypothetical protein
MSATRAQIERLTEANIGAAIRAVTTRHVELFWSPTDEGLSKESARTCFEVRVLPRESEGYSSRQITLRAVLAVIASREDDATGAHMTEMFEALLGIIGGWDKDNDASAAALDIAGVFRCDGVMFGSGGDCGYDEQRASWYATMAVEIVGCLVD